MSDGDVSRRELAVTGGLLVVGAVAAIGVAALFRLGYTPREVLVAGVAFLLPVSAVGWVVTAGTDRRYGVLRTVAGFTAALLGVSLVVVLTAETGLVAFAPVVSPSVPLYVYAYAVTGALGYVFTVVGEARIDLDGTPQDRTEDGGANPDEEETQDEDDQQNPDENDQQNPDEDDRENGNDDRISTQKIYDWSIRVLASIPLAAAVFLLSSLLLPEAVFGAPEATIQTANRTITVTEGSEIGPVNGTRTVTGVEVGARAASDRLLAGVSLLTGLFVNTAYTRLNDLATSLLSYNRGGSD